MTTVIIELDNGRTILGSLWLWRPKQGYIEITNDDGDLIRIDLNRIKKATEQIISPGHDRQPKIENRDLLLKAKEDGWK